MRENGGKPKKVVAVAMGDVSIFQGFVGNSCSYSVCKIFRLGVGGKRVDQDCRVGRVDQG